MRISKILVPRRAELALAVVVVCLAAPSIVVARTTEKRSFSTLGASPSELTATESAKVGAPRGPEQLSVPLAPPTTDGVCTYSTLTSGVSQTPADWTYYTFTQSWHYWSAFGVRAASGEDWDMYVDDTTTGSP